MKLFTPACHQILATVRWDEQALFDLHGGAETAYLVERGGGDWRLQDGDMRLYFGGLGRPTVHLAPPQPFLEPYPTKRTRPTMLNAEAQEYYPGTMPRKCVYVQDRQSAISYALSIYETATAEPLRSELIFWTDASTPQDHKTGRGVTAVTVKQAGRWLGIVGRMTGPERITEVELFAINEALKQAIRELEASDTPPDSPTVRVFSDSTAALEHIRWMFAVGLSPERRTSLALEDISVHSDRLAQLGAHVDLHWVPRNKVYGNMRADDLARSALCDLRADENANGLEPCY